MPSVSCGACRAQFDVDFEPGAEFTCGACGAIVTVPAVVVPGPRAKNPLRPKRGPAAVKPRPAPAPAPNLPKTSVRDVLDRGDGKKLNVPLIAAAGGGIVVLALLLIIVLSSKNDETGADGAGSAAARGGAVREPPPDPYALAWTAARKAGSTRQQILDVAEMAWKKSQVAHRLGKKDDEKKYSSHWMWAYREILRKDPDHALANERLGNVLFDMDELEGYRDLDFLSTGVQDDVEMLIEDMNAEVLKDSKRRQWLRSSNKWAQQWISLKELVDGLRESATERTTDSWYPRAISEGESLARELSTPKGDVDLHLDGVEGSAFLVVANKPYLYLIQRSSSGFEDRIAERWNMVLQQLLDTFCRLYENDAGVTRMDRTAPIVVLRDVNEYQRYLRRGDSSKPITSGGHFEPWSNRIVCFMSTEDRQRTVLFHEGTHQLVAFAMRGAAGAGPRQALWFSEGMAEYFGGHGEEYKGGRKLFVPGLLNEGSIKTCANAKERGDLMSLPELLDYSRATYNADNNVPTRARKVGNAYAAGWALCYLLQEWKKDKYGEKFVEYMKEEWAGRSGKGPFTKIFGTANLPEIEKDLHDMIDELEKARKDKKIINGKLVR